MLLLCDVDHGSRLCVKLFVVPSLAQVHHCRLIISPLPQPQTAQIIELSTFSIVHAGHGVFKG